MKRDADYYFELWLDKRWGAHKSGVGCEILRPILMEAFKAGMEIHPDEKVRWRWEQLKELLLLRQQDGISVSIVRWMEEVEGEK